MVVCSEHVTADPDEEMGDTFEGTLSVKDLHPHSGEGCPSIMAGRKYPRDIPGASQMSSAYTSTGWAKQRVDCPD